LAFIAIAVPLLLIGLLVLYLIQRSRRRRTAKVKDTEKELSDLPEQPQGRESLAQGGLMKEPITSDSPIRTTYESSKQQKLMLNLINMDKFKA